MNHSEEISLSEDTINNYFQLIGMTTDQWKKYQEVSAAHSKAICNYRKTSLPEKGLPSSPIKKKTEDLLKQYSQSLELFSQSIQSSLLLQNLRFNTLFTKYSKLLSTLQNNQGCILSELRVIPSSQTNAICPISIYDEGSVSAKDHRESLKPYHFDYCFSPSHSQLSIFQFNEPVLTSVIDGYRICMLLYGSNKTGKTFTLNGNIDINSNISNYGIVQMTIEYLLNYKASCKDKTFEIYLTICEMVNDELYDLHSAKHSKITVAETSNNIQLTGNESKSLNNFVEFITAYKTALASSISKDSHKFILIKTKRVTDIGIKVTGKLCFVDLASSDNKNKYVQSSLQSIKDVIRALKNKEKFVPYRSNKITLLLKEFLNVDSKLIILFHIENSTTNETIATLNYASLATPMELSIPKKYIELEANNVTNRKLNEEISSLKSEIKRLNEELKKSKSELQIKEEDMVTADAMIKSLKYQLEMKNTVFTDTKTDKENIDKKMFELKKVNDKLNEEIKQLEQKVNSMKYKEQLYKQKIDVLSNAKSGNNKNSSSSTALSADSKYLAESKALKELQMKYDKLERKYTKVELQLVQLTDNADLRTPDITPRPTVKKSLKQSNKLTTSPQVSSSLTKKKINNNNNSDKKQVYDLSKKSQKGFTRSNSFQPTDNSNNNDLIDSKNLKSKSKIKSKGKRSIIERRSSYDDMLLFPPNAPDLVENRSNSENNNNKVLTPPPPPPQLLSAEEEQEVIYTQEITEPRRSRKNSRLKSPPSATIRKNHRRKSVSEDSSPASDSEKTDTSPFPFLLRKSHNANNDIVNLLQFPSNNNNNNNSKSVYDNLFNLSPDSISEEDEEKRMHMYVSPISSPDYSDLEDNDSDNLNIINNCNTQEKIESRKNTPNSTKSSNTKPPRYNGSNNSNRSNHGSGTNSPLNGNDAFFNGLESPNSLTRSLYSKLYKMELENKENENKNHYRRGKRVSGEEEFFDGLVTLTPREKKEKRNAIKIQSWYRGLIERRKYMDMLFELKHGSI